MCCRADDDLARPVPDRDSLAIMLGGFGPARRWYWEETAAFTGAVRQACAAGTVATTSVEKARFRLQLLVKTCVGPG